MNWAAILPYLLRALGAFATGFAAGSSAGLSPGKAAAAAAPGALTQLFPSVKQPQ